MFSKEILYSSEAGLEHEIERKCIALGLNVEDENRVTLFVKDLLANLDAIRAEANEGHRIPRLKLEIYGLSVLMHRTNNEVFGKGYLSQFDVVAKQERTWAIIARAIWRELENRHIQ